ncbi:MAG TPA: TadE/TadG family type IV pilus assembly protein [Acidimicrobiia bacterium]|nr:TadE/TadG family type IV pilus assembly protein [Acidimicrobiia bacterium]
MRDRRDRGANLVEFALLAPFLLLLIFGMIEFAWLFSQNLDARHGAREGARLIAVNYPIGPVNPAPSTRTSAQTDQIVAEICNRMDVTTGALVTLQSAGDVGDPATAKVDSPPSTLTGFMDWAIPASLRLVSEVEIRVEQPAGWADTNPAGQLCP